MQAVSLLQQAQTAVKAGHRQQAHQLLRQAIRQDPDNHLVWLWLAKTSATPQASLDYVKRAEQLMPEDALVLKARAWAERRVTTASSQANADRKPLPVKAPNSSHKPWFKTMWRVGLALTAVILLIALGVAIWRSAWPEPLAAPGQADLDMTPRAAAQSGQQEVRLLNAPALVGPTATATPMPTPLALAKKVVGQNNDPRPTWTTTPLPTDTPTPTPTPLPTFISVPWQKPEGRPLGVGPDERWVDVDLSEQTLYAYEGNSLIFETLISSGLPQHETVTGQFRIWYRAASQTMDGSRLGYDYYLDNVPFVMYFFEDYSLHGTYWHNNFGHPMSHGCVNMRTEDAAWVFEWAEIGTLVNVHQ